MNNDDFNSLIRNTQLFTSELLTKKGSEYSSNFDRLANFKVNAKRLNLTPLQVWSVYAFKHVDAVESYIRKIHEHTPGINENFYRLKEVDKTLSEPITGRFYDLINYCYLGLALIEEVKSAPAPEVLVTPQVPYPVDRSRN